MAVKQAGADFAQEQKQFNEALKSGDFRRVYLLCGEQAYLRLQNRDKLVKTLMDDGDAMNLSRYSGSDVTALELIDMAQTLPFFADRRVIVLENTGLLNPKTASKSVTGRGTASSIADEADKIAALGCQGYTREKCSADKKTFAKSDQQTSANAFFIICIHSMSIFK